MAIGNGVKTYHSKAIGTVSIKLIATQENVYSTFNWLLICPVPIIRVCAKEVACGSVVVIVLKGAMMKTTLALAVACVVLVTAMTGTAFAASKTNQISVRYVPQARAEYCDEEYAQVQEAFIKLVLPHIDIVLAEENLDRTWLPEPDQ
jgi:hypothetical protein